MKMIPMKVLQVLLIMFAFPAWAGNIVFRHLDMSDNLSHYSVMALYQDEKGLIWMGTRNGVSVYDGNNMTTYKHSLSDSTTIHNNYIRDIDGNQNGFIYFLTNRGVSVFDRKCEVFVEWYKGYAEDIACFRNDLYVAEKNRILKFPAAGGESTIFYELPDQSMNITSFLLNEEELLIGTERDGMFVCRPSDGECTHLIECGQVSDIFKDTKGRYWVGTLEQGLYLYQQGETICFRHHPQDETSLCADFVRKVCEDKQGNIWVGTFKGLNKYKEGTGTFECFIADAKTKLTYSSVWSMICDVQGTLWVGTYFGGVNYFNASQTVCQHYITDKHTEGVLVVGTMVEDNERNLWICTEGEGLCRLNLETNEASWFKHDAKSKNSLSHNNLKSIYYDCRKNVLWIGTHLGGLNRFDLNIGKFTRYMCGGEDEFSYKSNIICDIVPYGDDLLLATHNGVYRFDTSIETFVPMFKDAQKGDVIGLALDLQIDNRGMLWIAGTDKGIYAYDFNEEKLCSYLPGTSLSSNGVNCLYEDSDNRLWLCMAESGIDLYRSETDDFDNFDEEHHKLLSNCVYGACEMGKDKLLFITDNGFSCLDYANRQFRNFKTNVSLPLAGINQKSIYRASNGRIYVGGVDGLISFMPEDLEQEALNYQIFPSKLFVNDEEITVGDRTGILQSAFSDTPKITLKSGQNTFSVVYSVTNYVPLVREEMVYKLENFSDQWSVFRNGKMVTYTNLDPGTYTLVVQNVEEAGEQAPVSRLEIEVLPPWFRSNWAYGCYVVLLCVFLYVVMRLYKNRVRLQAELEYERKHIKDVENLNQYKLRFFTNISHEFRTPLTIIIGQVELLLQIKSFVPAVYSRILNVYKSSMQLQSLVTELLDFRKQEQGQMKIKVSLHNMVGFLEETFLLFKEYAQTKGIEFSFVSSEERIEVWYDSKQMQKVVNNLLSNAFQYTPQGGSIVLKVEKEENEVVVSVSDTGKGIKKGEIVYIFDRFYQTEATLLSPAKGTGIGLALTKGIVELHRGNIEVDSEEGKGTVFTFHLPLGYEHFRPEEMVEEGMSDKITMANEEQRNDVYLMEEEEKLPEQPNNIQNFRILIVEDDEALRALLVDIFQPYYIVEQAGDGQAGWEKVVELQPDIVLSDVLMPGMSGIELCKRIKSQMDTCHIPIVLLTARTAIEHKLEGLQYGADDYIVKPFDVNILLARCRNIINSRIVLQEKFSKQLQTTAQIFATNPLDKEFMDKVVSIIENNLDNVDFNVNMFAQEMAIARTKLFVKLKAITGQTPNDFILTTRMKKAAYLLKNHPELNVSEISDRTGFSSPRYFSRVFKERYNVTPQMYRKGNAREADEEHWENDEINCD